MIAVLVVLTLALVLLGAVFAAGESAIAALPAADLGELAQRHPTWALRRVASDPARHVLSSGFLRVVSEMAAAVCVTILADRLLGLWWLALIVALAVMTAVSYLLVGASPRAIGRSRPERVIRATSGLIGGTSWLLGPMGSGLSRLGTRGRAARSVASEEYLLNMVDKASESEVIEDDERDLIHQVVEFGDTIVREVMVPRTDMVTIGESASLGEALGVFLSRGVSRIPVIGEDVDDVRGVLFLRDAAKRLYERGDDASSEPAEALMRPAVFVPESKPADEVLRLMQAESTHMVIIIDEYGGVAGLATMEDVIEEILGQISDESDKGAPEVEKISDGVYRVSARLGLHELGELFDLDLDEDDVDSVGGLFLKSYGKMAERGATTSVSGLELMAESVESPGGRLLTVIASAGPELQDVRAAFARRDEEGGGRVR